jgi:hypothetical protein
MHRYSDKIKSQEGQERQRDYRAFLKPVSFQEFIEI